MVSFSLLTPHWSCRSFQPGLLWEPNSYLCGCPTAHLPGLGIWAIGSMNKPYQCIAVFWTVEKGQGHLFHCTKWPINAVSACCFLIWILKVQYIFKNIYNFFRPKTPAAHLVHKGNITGQSSPVSNSGLLSFNCHTSCFSFYSLPVCYLDYVSSSAPTLSTFHFLVYWGSFSDWLVMFLFCSLIGCDLLSRFQNAECCFSDVRLELLPSNPVALYHSGLLLGNQQCVVCERCELHEWEIKHV